ncbi:MAG: magnesium transporter CorA family protein, partial [Candidatus Dormibacteria bacterium]
MQWLVTGKGVEKAPTRSRVQQALRNRRGPLWLDIQTPGKSDFELLLSDFGIHQLTVEDIEHGGQRPKCEDYPGYVFLVLQSTARQGDRLMAHDHYLCISPRWVVSVHSKASPALDSLRERLGADPTLGQGRSMFLAYLSCEAIVDATLPVLDRLDDEVDQVEDRLMGQVSRDDLTRITSMRHSVTDLRRLLGAQRDAFQRLITQSLNPAQPETALYFRDVYDHLVRQYETVDSLRDLLSGALDTYLSTVSNQLNGTMKT